MVLHDVFDELVCGVGGVASFHVGMKCVILVARSVTVSTLSNTRPSRVTRGNQTIQSIPIACNFCTGNDTRSMSPRGLW